MKRYFVEIYEEETDKYLLQTKYYNSVEECHEFIRQISYLMLECYHMAIMVAEGEDEWNYDIKLYEVVA